LFDIIAKFATPNRTFPYALVGKFYLAAWCKSGRMVAFAAQLLIKRPAPSPVFANNAQRSKAEGILRF
jgi:hypothetical protein